MSTDAELAELLAKLEEEATKIQEVKSKIKADRAAKESAELKKLEKRVLSDAEKAEVRAVFDEFDTDKSGHIDRGELDKCVTKLGCQMTAEELTEAIKAMDKNDDNKVSFDEFVEWYTSDAKLGGISGTKLTLLKSKLRASQIADSITRQIKRAKAAEKLRTESNSVSSVDVSIKVRGEHDAKVTAAISLVPSTAELKAAAFAEAYDAGLEKDTYQQRRKAINKVVIEVEPDTTIAQLSSCIPHFEEFAPKIDHATNLLTLYIPAAAMIDEILGGMFSDLAEEIEEGKSDKALDVIEPMAASVTLAHSVDELVSNRQNFYLHNVIDGLQLNAKMNASYKGVEALIMMMTDVDGTSSYTRERNIKAFLPKLMRAAGVQRSENSVTLKNPDEAVTEVALGLVKRVRAAVAKYFEENPGQADDEDRAAAKAFVEGDEFAMFVKRRMCSGAKDVPIQFAQLMLFERFARQEEGRQLLEYIRTHLKRVVSFTHTGHVGTVQAVFENLSIFALVPTPEDFKVNLAELFAPQPPKGLESLLDECFPVFDKLEFFDARYESATRDDNDW